MTRPIEQNLTVVPADVDGITVEDTDVTGPFPLALPIDGALTSILPWNGVSIADLSGNGFYPLITFTTGLTGSVADVTIVGLDKNGNPQTEVVTMPGASSAVDSVNAWSRIESMTIDAVYTNLSVGIVATTDQVSRWTPFDHYQSSFQLMLDLEEVVDGSTVTIDLTTDNKFIRSGAPDPDTFYAADAPFAGAVASQNQVVAQVPIIAARVRHTAGTAGQWRVRWLQMGGGLR